MSGRVGIQILAHRHRAVSKVGGGGLRPNSDSLKAKTVSVFYKYCYSSQNAYHIIISPCFTLIGLH